MTSTTTAAATNNNNNNSNDNNNNNNRNSSSLSFAPFQVDTALLGVEVPVQGVDAVRADAAALRVGTGAKAAHAEALAGPVGLTGAVQGGAGLGSV